VTDLLALLYFMFKKSLILQSYFSNSSLQISECNSHFFPRIFYQLAICHFL